MCLLVCLTSAKHTLDCTNVCTDDSTLHNHHLRTQCGCESHHGGKNNLFFSFFFFVPSSADADSEFSLLKYFVKTLRVLCVN